MAGLKGAFFDTSILMAGIIDFGRSSHHALLLMDAVADGRIERPMTAWRQDLRCPIAEIARAARGH